MPSSAKGVVVPAFLIVRLRARAGFHRRMMAANPGHWIREEHRKTAETLDDAIKLFTE